MSYIDKEYVCGRCGGSECNEETAICVCGADDWIPAAEYHGDKNLCHNIRVEYERSKSLQGDDYHLHLTHELRPSFNDLMRVENLAVRIPKDDVLLLIEINAKHNFMHWSRFAEIMCKKSND